MLLRNKIIFIILLAAIAGIVSCNKSKKTNPANYRLKSISTSVGQRYDFYYNSTGLYDSIQINNADSFTLRNFKYINNKPVRYEISATRFDFEYFADGSTKHYICTKGDSSTWFSSYYTLNNNIRIKQTDFGGGISDTTFYSMDNQNCLTSVDQDDIYFDSTIYTYQNITNPFFKLDFLAPLATFHIETPYRDFFLNEWSKNIFVQRDSYTKNGALYVTAHITGVQLNAANLITSFIFKGVNSPIDYFFEYEYLK